MSETAPTRAWSAEETALLTSAPLIRVAAVRHDGSRGTLVTIGHVRVDGDELVRSLRGADGGWYRTVLRSRRGRIEVDGRRIDVAFAPDEGRADVVDDAYRARYGDDSGVRQMTRSPARDATLVMRPLAGDPDA